MSYDVSFRLGTQHPCPQCGQCAATSGKEVERYNHTSNTANMWREAGCDLAAYDGKLAKELEPALHNAIIQIIETPQKFKEMEPSNGWGTVKSTLAFLRNIQEECLRHPEAVVEVCY